MDELAFSFLVLFFVLLLCAFVPEIVNKHRLKWKIQSLGLPSFKGHPFLGNLFQMLGLHGRNRNLSFGVYIGQAALGYANIFGSDLVCATVAMTSYVGFIKAKSVEALLRDTNEVNKTSDYKFSKPWLGNGLLTVDRDNWKRQRKRLIPTFHFKILEQFQIVMGEQADVLAKKFQCGVGKNFICIDSLIDHCTFGMITETAFGVKSEAQGKNGSPIVVAVSKVTSSIFERILTPWQWPDFLYRTMPSGRTFYQNLDVINTYVRKIIQERKVKLAKEVETGLDDDMVLLKRRAFLDLLLLHNFKNKDDQLTDQEIEDEVHTFNFAGFDSTAVSIKWLLYMLGLHSEVQEQARKEIDEIFSGDSERLVTLDDIKKMTYLESVIKETQRLFPPVPFIARCLQDDFTVCGVTLPKGCTCLIAVACLHRDPETFPNPEVFDPDRFLVANRHPFAFIPFSAGPRNCIGQRFAMMEIKTVASSLLRKYKLTSLDPRDKVLISPEVTTRPHRPFRIRIELRNL